MKKIIPKKQQYKKWTLPNKYSYWSFLIGIVGFLLAILSIALNGNPFKEKIIIDNLEKALNYKEKAKYNFDNQQFKFMLTNMEKSIELYTSQELIDYMGIAYVRNKKYRDAINFLSGHNKILSETGKGLLITSEFYDSFSNRKTIKKDELEQYLMRYERLELFSIENDALPHCLLPYVISSMNKSKKDFYNTSVKLDLFIQTKKNYNFPSDTDFLTPPKGFYNGSQMVSSQIKDLRLVKELDIIYVEIINTLIKSNYDKGDLLQVLHYYSRMNSAKISIKNIFDITSYLFRHKNDFIGNPNLDDKYLKIIQKINKKANLTSRQNINGIDAEYIKLTIKYLDEIESIISSSLE
jgi:hypothetical protein